MMRAAALKRVLWLPEGRRLVPIPTRCLSSQEKAGGRPTIRILADIHPRISVPESSSSSTSSSSSKSNATTVTTTTKIIPRLPPVLGLTEFEADANKHTQNKRRRKRQATWRILQSASRRLFVEDLIALHLLVVSGGVTLGLAAVEGALYCQSLDFSYDSYEFILSYSLHQMIPSIVWDSQSASLVAQSLNLDPETLLRDFSSSETTTSIADAQRQLSIHLLETCRYFVAGFVMIASIVRAATISTGAVAQYQERIQQGREGPFVPPSKHEGGGLVVRLCGQGSYTTERSLQTMGVNHIWPVFESPHHVQSLVWKYSEGLRRPIYWSVQEGKYGSAYSWDGFPTEEWCLIPTNNNKNNKASEQHKKSNDTAERLLILEADATNARDPLAFENEARDLTLDDAAQGFRRIQQRFEANLMRNGRPNFRTLRVYLGNSLQVTGTGGGHSYTLRHRVQYAKEVDVLIDSRAPVLQRILEWCRRVAAQDKRILFQTSSPEYFANLSRILKCYGHEVYDPLDIHTLHKSMRTDKKSRKKKDDGNTQSSSLEVLLGYWDGGWLDQMGDDELILLQDMQQQDSGGSKSTPSKATVSENAASNSGNNSEKSSSPPTLRQVAKMATLPRLVHMPTTSETVNAVEALITAGEVNGSNCCAILERHEGVQALEGILQAKSRLVQSADKRNQWIATERATGDPVLPVSPDAEKTEDKEDDRRVRNGLQMICTSSIYDDLFRQVRQWARMGFTNAQIQTEMDLQFQEILFHSQKFASPPPSPEPVAETTLKETSEGKEKADAK